MSNFIDFIVVERLLFCLFGMYCIVGVVLSVSIVYNFIIL